ncbi:MAG: sterol desaturase family protein [Archangium sp.]|nr:sterol desaturase family protein [Archangium sp.]
MFTAQTIADISPFALAAAVGLMLALESLSPLVPLLPGKPRARHALKNLSIALCTSVFAVSGNFALVAVAMWGTHRGYGLLNLFDTPWLLRFAVALAGLDFFEWIRHRLHHRVPLLWRLHRVHHTDPHVDSTTALRGHPLESVIAYSFFSLLVLAFGIDPLALALRSLVAAVALAWHHADFRMPARLDALISLVTPTPRTHRLHHSRNIRFTDSNYGTIFTWWDRLLGTFSPGDSQEPGKTGLEGFDSPEQQSLLGVLRSPLLDIKHDAR